MNDLSNSVESLSPITFSFPSLLLCPSFHDPFFIFLIFIYTFLCTVSFLVKRDVLSERAIVTKCICSHYALWTSKTLKRGFHFRTSSCVFSQFSFLLSFLPFSLLYTLFQGVLIKFIKLFPSSPTDFYLEKSLLSITSRKRLNTDHLHYHVSQRGSFFVLSPARTNCLSEMFDRHSNPASKTSYPLLLTKRN